MAAAGAYMVHFRSTDPEVFARWGATWHFQNAAGTIIAQNDDDIWTLQRWLIPGENPADLTPEAVLEEWVGAAFEYEILQANPWEANFVVASSYGNDRVILAGDAAHQYIPTGGYGMNSGVADAWGLSWMLAGLVQGWGGNKLVAAHEAERKTTAWWHLDAARRHFNVRIQIGDVYMAAGDLGGKGASARREAVGEKIKALGNAENESWGVEHGYRYDESPIIFHEADCPEVDPLAYVPNTCPGVRLPHVFLEPGVSLHDRLGRYFTLVVLDGTDVSAVETAAAELAIPLTVLRLDRADLAPVYQCKLLLVRPDQHIAWRGNQLPADVFELLRVVSGR